MTDIKYDGEINRIPHLIGKSGESVVPVLENMGLDVRYTGVGKVKAQSIPAGSSFRKGETIYLALDS